MMDSILRKPPGKDTMSEKSSWSQVTKDVGDTFNEVTSMPSTEIRMPKQEFARSIDSSSDFCSDAVLGDGSAAIDNNLYCYSFGPISQLDNGINFCNNDHDDQGNSSLLCDGWPDIGNFEDIDMMLSCDSTFGLENPAKEDELCWFPSSHTDEGSYDVIKSGFNVSTSESSALRNVSEDHDALRSSSAAPSINDSSKKHSITSESTVSPTVESDAALKQQVNLHRKQPKQENQLEEERNNGCLGNGNIFPQYDIIEQFADVNYPLGDLSSSASPSLGVQQHEKDVNPHSMNYVQTDMPHMHLNCGQPADQIALFTAYSSGQSGDDSQPSPLAKESSYASNQVVSVDSAQGPSFDCPMSNNVKREHLYHLQDLQTSVDGNVKYTFCNPDCNSRQVQQPENHDSHSANEEINISMPVELDSENANESSFIGSASGGISVEASSLHQLQQVMGKLDIRTKLCIRNSLYRLATSVKKRHDFANLNGAIRYDKEVDGTLLSGETDKCAGYMDMETSTNPIDRSIAQLLFHRSSEPSSMSDVGALSFKSPAMVNASESGPAMTAEEKVFREETSSGACKQFAGGDQ